MSVVKNLGLALVAVLAIATTGLAVSTTANAYPPGVDETVTGSTSVVSGGGSITLRGSGWVPGETITITLNPVLGTTTADANGNFEITVTIPTSTTCGPHTLVATGSITDSPASPRPRDDVSAPDADNMWPITVTEPCVTPSGQGQPPSQIPPTTGVSVTGVAAMGIGALGFVLLVGGGVMLLLGRRRKASS